MTGFSPLITPLSPPPIPEVQGWVGAYDGSLGPLIDLSQAVPGYPPHEVLLQWLGDAAADPALAGYGDIEGELVLRQAFAAWTAKLYQAPLSAANIQVTSGCNQAFTVAALAVAAPGDEILLTSPSYFNHETSLGMLGIEAGYVSCLPENGFVPRPEVIEAAISDKTRALVLISPNNPTGAVYSPEVLAEIYKICRQRKIWLIIDETYRDFLPVSGRGPHGLFGFQGWEDTFIGLYSFSKSFCIPGQRLGAMIVGPDVIAQTVKIMDNLQICAPRSPQIAVAQAIPRLSGWRDVNRVEIIARSATLREVMAALPDWQVAAMGAYFAFVQHPFGAMSSVDVARKLAHERGVLTIPGRFFGADHDGYLRVAFANADRPTLKKLADRLR